MDILGYLLPDNSFSWAVVVALWGVFICWIVLLVRNWIQLSQFRQQVQDCNDESITGKIKERFQSQQSAEEAFKIFFDANNLAETSIITKHIRAIFDAGWNESQLDVTGLVKNTTNELLKTNHSFRSILSLFIILGLLGTLFGLASTLATLAPLSPGSTQVTNDLLAKGLSQLLGELKGAFAPSIWGVSFTIIGVGLFSFYLHRISWPLHNAIERRTLVDWVPHLILTGSQNLALKLQLSERQVNQSLEAVHTIHGDAEKLLSTIRAADSEVSQMGETSSRLNDFSRTFVEGVIQLTSFQQELRTLYRQLVDESRVFQESVNQNIEGAKTFQNEIREQLTQQNQELTRVLQALNAYETAYISERREIDSGLKNLMELLKVVSSEAGNAFANLSRRNEEIGQALAVSLGEPLRTEISEGLGKVEQALQSNLQNVDGTLQARLEILATRLGGLDAPIVEAAKNFGSTFANFNERTTELHKELQQEFYRRNENNEKQLTSLEQLGVSLTALLEQLTRSSSNFADRGQQLSSDVTALSTNVTSLSQSISALEQRLGATGVPPPADNTEILSYMRELHRTTQAQGEQIQSLSQSLSKLASSIAAGNRHRRDADYTPESTRPLSTPEQNGSAPEVKVGVFAKLKRYMPFRGGRK
jgi:biopolymer transport protein ExbB/TolQ